jgi:uncharacterized protein
MSVAVVVALVAFGLLIGLSMGAVGAGGSIIAVPVLVYVAGQPPKEATASALVVVLLTSLVALRPHWAQRRVRLDVAIPFALAGFGGAAIGALGSKQVPGDVLMLAFSGVLAGSAMLLFRRNRAATAAAMVTSRVSSPQSASTSSKGSVSDGLAGLLGNRPVAATVGHAVVSREIGSAPMSGNVADASPDGGVRSVQSPRSAAGAVTHTGTNTVTEGDRVRDGRLRTLSRTLFVGALVGVLTGVFGVGGGFVIVPALALLLGLTMAEAVGTSLLVIAANAAFTFLLKAGDTSLDWSVLAVFTAAAAVGAMAGSEVSRRFDSTMLTRWFVRGVAVVALYTFTRSVLALVG